MQKENITATKNVLVFADSNRRAILAAVRLLSKNKNVNIIYAIEESFPDKMIGILLKKYTNTISKYNKNDILNYLITTKETISNLHILPVNEGIIRLLLKNNFLLKEHNISFCINNLKDYELISNKESFKTICKNNNLLVPKEIDNIPTKYTNRFVIKAKSHSTDKNTLAAPMLIENKNNLTKLNSLDIDINLHFIQEYIKGPSIYYNSYYVNGKKSIYFTQLNISQQPNGKSVIKAIPYDIPSNIIKNIDEIFYNLKWNGPIMFELKLDIKTQKYYCIECNPRLWGPIQLSIDNGIDFISPIINEPSQISKNNKKHGYIWINGYIDSYIIMKKLGMKSQVYKNINTSGILFKDIYLRKDTFIYFIFELMYFLKLIIINIFNVKLNKCTNS